MGLSIALGGGIASIAIITMFTIFGSAITQIYELNSSRTESSDLNSKLIQTDIDMQLLHSQAGSDFVSFTLENTGNEKLWSYSKFHVIVTYDADIAGVLTPTTEVFTFNSAQAFALAGSSGGISQFARPDEDVSKGGWTDTAGGDGDTVLYDEIDESTRNDADYSESVSLTLLGQTDTWQVGLSGATDPQTSSNHIVRYAYQKSAAGVTSLDLTVRLLQGTTQIASWTHSDISSSFTLAEQTLSAVQTDSITNYSDLRLEFIATHAGGVPVRSVDVSWAEFEVPSITGNYDCTATSISAGQWTIDKIIGDLADPEILNTSEDGRICIKLSNQVFANGNVEAVITTDVGKTASSSLTV